MNKKNEFLQRTYEGKIINQPVDLVDILNEIPVGVKLDEVKIVPVYNVFLEDLSELIGFRVVAMQKT